ncbi:MAG: ComF family protein [Clostridia bacterium]
MKNRLHKFGKYILDTLFPSDIKCMFCHEELNQDEHNNTCIRCQKILPYINRFCPRCGAPISENNTGVCVNCKINNYDFVSARSVFVYDDKIMQIIRSIKYDSKKHYIPPLAKYLAELYATMNISPDYVTCVPLHTNREKARGFNQSKLLAKNFSDLTFLPFIDMTDKVVDNVSQTTLGYTDRVENVRDVYKLKPEMKKIIKNKKILIIDDLLTTGSTASELSRILMNGGATACYVLTIAHGDTEKLDKNEEKQSND